MRPLRGPAASLAPSPLPWLRILAVWPNETRSPPEAVRVFYNRQRRHSTLGHRSPADYETSTLSPTEPIDAARGSLPLARPSSLPQQQHRSPNPCPPKRGNSTKRGNSRSPARVQIADRQPPVVMVIGEARTAHTGAPEPTARDSANRRRTSSYRPAPTTPGYRAPIIRTPGKSQHPHVHATPTRRLSANGHLLMTLQWGSRPVAWCRTASDGT